MRTKAKLPESFVNALLADISTALLAGTLSQIEKQLKLIPLPFPLRFQTQHEIIYTTHKENV
jgi:hypothetical protein